MRIAVPTKDNVVEDHFGHCQAYTVFTVEEDNKVVASETLIAPKGCGCKSNIASLLKEKDVDVMLAGNMGNGAFNKLNKQGIKVYRGCSGDVHTLISTFRQENIRDSGESCNHHKHHGHGHSCNH